MINNIGETYPASVVMAALEEFAPLSLQEAWDNAGLLVGSSQNMVRKALLTLDVTEEVVDEAIECGADMIISHHPLIFSGMKKITDKSYVERAVVKAIRNNILIYASHTNIDAAEGGVSYKMGEKIGLDHLCPLMPSGLGLVGELREPQGIAKFVATLKKRFDAPMVRYTEIDRKISRVALCGGAGAEFIDNAIAAGADVYVSADFKYHDFFKAEKQMAVVDIGHFESERYTLEIFYDIFSKKLPNFATQITSVNSNPINYL